MFVSRPGQEGGGIVSDERFFPNACSWSSGCLSCQGRLGDHLSLGACVVAGLRCRSAVFSQGAAAVSSCFWLQSLHMARNSVSLVV